MSPFVESARSGYIRGMHRWAACCSVTVLLLGPACGGSGSGGTRREAGETAGPAASAPAASLERFPVPGGSGPHDVAPAPDGTVWFTAQAKGVLGRLDPATGRVTEVPLGQGSGPHGVIVGPDGAAWVTDPGLNAVLRVDPVSQEVKRFALPPERAGAVVHTATFDRRGTLWFTGNAGVYGRLDPATGNMQVFDAPRGPGPYGITATPDGTVWYASLAGNHIARVDPATGQATVIEPPTPGQGARRIWSDSLVRFDPATEAFSSHPLPDNPGNVRQILGRPGEVWGAESAADALVRLKTLPLGR
jgi:virginiamycin B lyase